VSDIEPRFSVVVCDDIRQETSGKLILIGVYQDNITAKLPIDVGMSIWVRFLDLPAGEHSIEFEMHFNGNEIVKGGGEIGSNTELSVGGFALPKVEVPLVEPGTLEFFVALDKGEMKLVGKLPVIAVPEEEIDPR